MSLTIEQLVKEQIEQLDIRELVQGEIRKLISDEVKRSVVTTTKEEIQKIIKTEVEIVLSKGVQTNDGWGKTENYTSFEELFKKHFKEALNSKYEVQRVIQDYVKEQTKKLVDEKSKEIISKLQSFTNS